MGLNWTTHDYFVLLLQRDKRAHSALEMLVDDLHAEKERTVNKFLCHSGSEDFLWGLVRLLGNVNFRVAGNAAYILGTLAENEAGSYRVIGLTSSRHPDTNHILRDLTNMLVFNDSESVMNAAGTMGTLAESTEGRQWMLSEPCLSQTICHITELLSSSNMWTASNAALVLARISISEEGCERILGHEKADSILCQLINSLGVDEAGRGMNAAFAVGRLCDMDSGRKSLLALPESEKMISSLARMLCCNDPGASKNACFALSCLATNKDGHVRLLRNTHSEDVLKTLAELLSSEDSETGWFAAMTLKTLASQPRGCVRLRNHSAVLPALKSIEMRHGVNVDLRDEVVQTLELLKRLDKPLPPTAQVLSSEEVAVTWDPAHTKSGLQVRYQLYEGGQCVYNGFDLQFTLKGLKPYTEYSLRLRAMVEGDESALSDPVVMVTGEAVPGPPQNLRTLGSTTTQLKVGWEPPGEPNGVVKGYYVYNGEKMVDHTSELNCILSGLQPSTSYEVQVCAATSKGKGPRETVTGTTSELGAHAPSKPEVMVRGRNEINVMWRPPEVPLGRITRFDLVMNGEVIYSGTELHHVARRLKPDTEYTFTVSAVTSEGRCESKPTKKRTAKDEYEGDRAPLYQSPAKKEATALDLEKKDDTKHKRRKSVTELGRRSGSAHKMQQENTPVYKLSYTTAAPPQVKPKETKLAATEVHVVDQPAERPPSAEEGNTMKAETTLGPSVQPTLGPNSQPTLGPSAPIPLGPSAQSLALGPLARVEAWELSLESFEKTELQKTNTNLSPSKSKASKQSDSQTAPSSGEESGGKSLPKPRPPPSLLRTRQRTRLSKSLDLVEDTKRNKSAASTNSETKPSHSSGHKRHRHKPALYVPHRESKAEGETLPQPRRRHSLTSHREESTVETSGGESEKQVTWATQPGMKRVERTSPEMISRTVSNLSPSYSPSPLSKRVGVTEFEAPLPSTWGATSQAAVPAHVQRANTFIATHRPGQRRTLEKLPHAPRPTSPRQFSPHFLPTPASQPRNANHNKFVPMQYRTQPCNLPGPVQRQGSSITAFERGTLTSLDRLGRSRTEVNLRSQTVIPRTDDMEGINPAFTLTSQALSKDRAMSGRSLNTADTTPYRAHLQPSSRGRQQSSPAVLTSCVTSVTAR